MNRQEQMDMLKQEYQQIEVPEEALTRLQAGIRKAKQEQSAKKPVRGRHLAQWAAAAAVLTLVAVPNISPQAAVAMSDIPVLKQVVEIVTFHKYEQADDSGNYLAHVETPQLEAQGDAKLQSSVGEINGQMQTYANQMIAQFEQEMEQQGGVYGLDIGYTVVTDTDQWFALEVSTVETMASGAETLKYYNLNKETGAYMQLADLFPQDVDYVAAISAQFKEQMLQRMAEDENQVYFINSDMPETDFKQIAADQSFYINQQGQLVIAFDEYEVAPGSMGAPQFIVDMTALQK